MYIYINLTSNLHLCVSSPSTLLSLLNPALPYRSLWMAVLLVTLQMAVRHVCFALLSYTYRAEV